MAVNTSEITRVYDALSEKVTNTLKTLLEDYSITEKERAQVISNTVTALIQTSVSAVLEEPLKAAQISQATAQTNAINAEVTIKQTQSTKDIEVKTAQKSLIDKQAEVETERKTLTTRQRTYYDDQLRIQESDHLSRVLMGALQAGSTLPDGLLTKAFDAAAAITPATP